jgi:hypothetical protein
LLRDSAAPGFFMSDSTIAREARPEREQAWCLLPLAVSIGLDTLFLLWDLYPSCQEAPHLQTQDCQHPVKPLLYLVAGDANLTQVLN